MTLVFTDTEGSTRLLEQLGLDADREALAEHGGSCAKPAHATTV